MTDYTELRRLAEGCQSVDPTDPTWYDCCDWAELDYLDVREHEYLAAVSPDVVLGLLDEMAAVKATNIELEDRILSLQRRIPNKNRRRAR